MVLEVITVVWDMKPCKLVKICNLCGETYCLNLQGIDCCPLPGKSTYTEAESELGGGDGFGFMVTEN